MKQVYIAGPMTGYEEFNYPLFHRHAVRWEAEGWAVHNPATSFNGNANLPYRLYMQAAINLLMQADAIALLPGWEESKGAKLECLIGQRLGLAFYNAETMKKMRLGDLDVGDPEVLRSGYNQKSKNADLIAALSALAAELAKGNRNGITASDLRRAGLKRGVLTGRESHAQLSCVGHALRRAGLENTGETRASDLEVTHGVQQTVWVEKL